MKKYPDIGIDPGVTPWKDDSVWKRDKVFSDLARWQHTQLASAESEKAKASWQALAQWHRSHPTSDTLVVGQHARINDELELRTPLLSWDEMWKVLKTHVSDAPAPAASAIVALVPERASTSAAPAVGARRFDRKAIGESTSAAVVNVVTHSGYTETDRRVAQLNDHEMGRVYLLDNLPKKGTLFFIKLAHREGEFAVGLGRRTFLEQPVDDLVDDTAQYEIEWFERKTKGKDNWGKQPGFRRAIVGYDPQRRPLFQVSTETWESFLPVAVKTTPGSQGSNEPSLSQDCMSALRAWHQLQPVYQPPPQKEGAIEKKKRKSF